MFKFGQKNTSRLRESQNKREEEGLKASKNSGAVAKNSKREKENEEVFKNLTIQKRDYGKEFTFRIEDNCILQAQNI